MTPTSQRSGSWELLFELLRDLQGPNLQTAPPLSTMPQTIAKMALCCTCLPEGVRPSIEGVGRTGPDRYEPQQPRNGHERRDREKRSRQRKKTIQGPAKATTQKTQPAKNAALVPCVFLFFLLLGFLIGCLLWCPWACSFVWALRSPCVLSEWPLRQQRGEQATHAGAIRCWSLSFLLC